MQALSLDSDAISAGESAPSLDEKWETHYRLGVEEFWCALLLLLPQLGSLFHYLVTAAGAGCPGLSQLPERVLVRKLPPPPLPPFST